MSGVRCVRRGLVVVLAALAVVLPGAAAAVGSPAAAGSGAPSAGASAAGGGAVPVFAYFYQWFNPSSWNRAKIDFPLAGKYSSDDPQVLRTQVRQAQGAGINGFLTSWKNTVDLDRRLSLLIAAARQTHLQLGVVYEALDFTRRPLPIGTVKADMLLLVRRWGRALRANSFGRPLIIWTGIDQYSLADVRAVRTALGDRALLLGAAKNVADYDRVAGLVDGDAYYWSSANPDSSFTKSKLVAMGAAVHAHHGLWLAPASPGFDGRPLGHTRVIPRNGGATLEHSLADAYASNPDAVGVISWNEWSENTYIEPGERYGSQELNVLRDYLQHRRGTPIEQPQPPAARHGSPLLNWSGLQAALALAVITCLGLILLTWRAQRRRPGSHRTDSIPYEDDDEPRVRQLQ